MKLIKVLKHNEDIQIEKLKRVREGKWGFLVYIFHLPLGLLSMTACLALLLVVAISAFTLIVSLLDQQFSHILDLTLLVFGGGLMGIIGLHVCTRVMFHVLRKPPDGGKK